MSKVEKLIAGYEERIKSIDVELYGIAHIIIQARKAKVDAAEYLAERKLLNDKRQIYFQFIKDLEDICTP